MLAKVPLELDEYLWAQWKCSRLAFVYAPLGFGKSEFAHRMLEGVDVLEVDAARVDVTQAVTAEASEKHDAVLVDNIHDAVSNAQGAALASVISRCTSTRFVFLSRAPMPGWLTPFFAKGELLIVTADDLLFTDTDIAHLLSANGIASTPELVERVANASQRYPLAVAAAIAHIQRDEGSSWEAPLRDEVMAYFEAEFENRFDEKTQDVLLLVPLFDTIDDDLIVHALGEDEGTRLLDALHHATSFITREGHTWKVREGMLNFCKWERARRRNDATVTDIVNRVIEYYESQGNFSSALDLCSRLSDDERMLAILEDHARLNPGSGSYYELEHYYHELPEDIVLSSPRLMRIMSMLDSMAMCITDSERWYTRLEEYAKAPERTSEERRTAESYLAFLDISLPHRHLTNIVAAVGALAKLHASDNPELVPSVTSGLPSVINGGRDLSPWTPSDDLTARAMSRIVGNALGRLGVGIVEIGLCESKFEKGGDVTPLPRARQRHAPQDPARRRPGARIRRRWHSVPLPHRPGEHPPGALPSRLAAPAPLAGREPGGQAHPQEPRGAALPHMAAARRDGAHARMARGERARSLRAAVLHGPLRLSHRVPGVHRGGSLHGGANAHGRAQRVPHGVR